MSVTRSIRACKALPRETPKNIHSVLDFAETMTHDTLLPEPLELKDDWIDVPTKSEIGWEFDDEKIAKYIPSDFPK